MGGTSDVQHRLGQVLGSFRHEFLMVALFSGVANLLLLTPTLYMLQVYDRVLAGHSGLTLLVVSAIALFLFAAMAFAEWTRSRVLVRASTRLDRELGSRVFDASFEAALADAGHSPAKAFADLTQVRQFLTAAGAMAFVDAPWVPVYLAVTFFLHPLLGWLALVFAGVQVLTAWLGHTRTAAGSLDAARAAAEVDLQLQCKLRNVETLEAMGMLPALRAQWEQQQRLAVLRQSAAHDAAQRVSALSKFVRYAQQSLTLGTGALLAVRGELTPGAMIAATVLMTRTLAPIDMVVSNWRGFDSARAAYLRLRDLLAAHEHTPVAGLPERPAGALQVRGLVASAAGRKEPILQGIALALAAGETLVVLGPSGSGKSTLARCLVGTWPGAQGEVLLDGQPLSRASRDVLGPHIGYLPQDVQLFDGTIAENIARMGVPRPDDVIAAARATGLHDAILRMPKGYDTPIGEDGGALSAGQRQRLGLARALYGDPAVLVLDEPNANLDDAGEVALTQAVLELRRRRRTLVLITHRLPAMQLADRVLVLSAGEVARFGAPADVLGAGPPRANSAAALPAAQPS